MKFYLLILFVVPLHFASAQKVEAIYVNLYTDSLKKGTFNYINIDGRLTNGKYLPLDSNYLLFQSSAGKFNGNNLWLDKEPLEKKIKIKVVLKKDPSLFKEFEVYIKQLPDPELKTSDEIRNPAKNNQRHK